MRINTKIRNFLQQDNHEEATIGAFLMCELLQMMTEAEDLDNDIDELLQVQNLISNNKS